MVRSCVNSHSLWSKAQWGGGGADFIAREMEGTGTHTVIGHKEGMSYRICERKLGKPAKLNM